MVRRRSAEAVFRGERQCVGSTAPRVRALVAWAVVGGVAAAALLLSGTTSADAQSSAEVQGVTDRGGELYQRWCAVCHATDGSGTAAGPPIDDVSITHMDLTMRTGYMPLAAPDRGVREREFTEGEREAALAYMVEEFGLTDADEIDEPGEGDPGRGQELYVVHCAQCHGANGEGGVAGQQATVPRTRGVEPIVIAQSVRVGQFQMPAFSEEQISDEELDDLVAFLEDQPSASPLGMADLTRVAAFVWAAALTAVILAACWWISRPVRAPDADLTADDQGAPQ